MATISSAGIGSGLDVNSIVTQLVALEKQPLKALELKATNVENQISSFALIKSQFATLTDVATRLAVPSAWAARNATSSNTSVATATATSAATAATLSLDVDQLAQQQSVSSAALPAGTMPGAGTLTLQLGTWGALGASFTSGSTAAVPVTILATDTIGNIASKINAVNAGVVASVFNDGSNERLVLTSKTTGEAAGFQVTSSDVTLAGLVFDPATPATQTTGMAAAGIPVQYGQDAKARINGLAVTSATNTLANNVAGVTINLLTTTTSNYGSLIPAETRSPITVRISEDVTPASKNVTDFVNAYNTLYANISDLTKYDATTKTAGLFQGDSSVVGMQNVLRSMIGSSSLGATSQRLADVGIEMQKDGLLTINTTKLSAAANDGTSLQQLFTNNNNNPLTDGFALKFKTFGQGVAATDGLVSKKAASLQTALAKNEEEQTRVTDRATLFESRLRARYSALDARMAQLTALNSYVTQQVTLWNKSTS